MELLPGLWIVDVCLYEECSKTLIISDAHFGFEEAMNMQGVLLPRYQWKDTKARLERIFIQHDVGTVVLNGDLKHEFGGISLTEWRHISRVIRMLQEEGRRVVIVEGNHDTFLKPIAQKYDIQLVPFYQMNDILIVHGDKELSIPRSIQTVVMGHEHSAVSLRKGKRVEKYKCFLKGKYKGKNLITMPSFNELTYGTDVLEEDLLSPLLKDIQMFTVYGVADTVYPLGTVKALRKTMLS